MNNKTIYSKKFTGYEAARQELEIAHRDFATWAEPKIMAHIDNAKRILAKHNNGRPSEDRITLASQPWTSPWARSFKIKSFNEDHAIIEYTMGSSTKSETHEFKFPLEWLSLSTWDFNKRVRQEIKVARNSLRIERARQARVQANETKAKISRARSQLQALEAEFARQDKAATL